MITAHLNIVMRDGGAMAFSITTNAERVVAEAAGYLDAGALSDRVKAVRLTVKQTYGLPIKRNTKTILSEASNQFIKAALELGSIRNVSIDETNGLVISIAYKESTLL